MYLVGSAGFTRHILGVQTGIGVPHISGQQIKDFTFWKPIIWKQHIVADELDEMKAQAHRLVSTNRRKLTAPDELKQSLLHQALTGAL